MEFQDGAVDVPVSGHIESVGHKAVNDAAEGIGVKENPPQDGFFHFDIEGR
jgi:hypothetical protein